MKYLVCLLLLLPYAADSSSAEPLRYYENARQAAGIWSGIAENKNSVAVAIRLAEEPEGPVNVITSKVQKRLQSVGISQTEFFLEKTLNKLSVFRFSYRGVTSEFYTLHNLKDGIAEIASRVNAYEKIDSMSKEELEAVLSK